MQKNFPQHMHPFHWLAARSRKLLKAHCSIFVRPECTSEGKSHIDGKMDL